jgi:hypothetical protein
MTLSGKKLTCRHVNIVVSIRRGERHKMRADTEALQSIRHSPAKLDGMRAREVREAINHCLMGAPICQ